MLPAVTGSDSTRPSRRPDWLTSNVERYHIPLGTTTSSMTSTPRPHGLGLEGRMCPASWRADRPAGSGGECVWLGGRDSNPDSMVQSHVSYRWTTAQCRTPILDKSLGEFKRPPTRACTVRCRSLRQGRSAAERRPSAIITAGPIFPIIPFLCPLRRDSTWKLPRTAWV